MENSRAIADRIMAKMGPMTPEEKQVFSLVTMRPEEYPRSSKERVCWCGARFKEIPESPTMPAIAVLDQFADHQATHSPSPAQWAHAYTLMQRGKDKDKHERRADQSPQA